MKKHLLALLGFCTVPMAVPAQMAGGKVVDAVDRRPLGGVSVVLRNVADDTALQTETDSGGMFNLFPPGAGRYVIVFRRGIDILVYPDTIALTADRVFQKLFILTLQSPDELVSPYDIDSPVVPLAALRARYPDDLVKRNFGGSVVARFVVDTTGRADMSTFRIVRSTDHGFSQAVRESVSSARFRPATSRGRKVRQLVSNTFNFCGPRQPPGGPTSAIDRLPLFSEPSCDQSRR